MGKKTTTTVNESSSKTVAPPAWTAPGLEQASAKVIEAMNTPTAKYTGDFTAVIDPSVTAAINDIFNNVGMQAGAAGQQLFNQSMAGPQQVNFGGPAAYQVPNLTQSPTVGTAPQTPASLGLNMNDAQTMLAQIMSMPNLQGPTLPTMGAYQAAALPTSQPNFTAAALPSMSSGIIAAPSLQGYDPTKWAGGTNGDQRLMSAMEAAIQPVMRQLTDQILPGIRSSAIESGAYSGDRAMMVLPQEALAETGRRASEITQGLAYEGYQQDQNRDLQAWQVFEQQLGQAAEQMNAARNQQYGIGQAAATANFGTMTDAALRSAGMENDFGLGLYGTNVDAALQSAGMANDFTLGSYNSQADALLQQFGITTDAQMKGMGIQQDAANSNAALATNTNLANKQQGNDALLAQFELLSKNAMAGYQAETQAKQQAHDSNIQALLESLGLGNEAYGLATDRGLGEAGYNLDASQAQQDSMMQALMMMTSQGDLMGQGLDLMTQQQQSEINNAMAQNSYEAQYPYQGLDTATNLLTALSGNWGTQTGQLNSTTTQKTGGLGAIAEGLIGAASIAASLGAFGPLGGAAGGLLGAAKAPVSGIFQNAGKVMQ